MSRTSMRGRYRREGAQADARSLYARVDRLVALVAERNALQAVERPLRDSVAAGMAALARRGGVVQVRRAGGLVSLVEPPLEWHLFDQQAFARWLVANGYEHLVTQRVSVTDEAALAGLLRRAGRVSTNRLRACLTIVVQPRADAPERLDATVRDDGVLVAADGQIIPGVRQVIRQPWVRVCAAARLPARSGQDG